jgi:catechol 2,3-dioxygenase-like lactoylglutathione lyase family enzyme
MAITYDGGLTCAFNVTDLDRSIGWYRDVCGFGLLYRLEDKAWCELTTSVVNVTLGLGEAERPSVQGGVTPTFGVTDIELAKAHLDAAGVRQDGGIRDIPGFVRLLTFYDPDGNTLMFYQDMRASQAD